MKIKFYYIVYKDCAGDVGRLANMYSSQEAAEEECKWRDTHRRGDDLYDFSVESEEIDTDEIKDEFVPPMTDEQFDALYGPHRYEI